MDLLSRLLVQQLELPLLRPVAECSLEIIDKASSIQIDTALKHNEAQVNKLLVKLLALNMLEKTQNEIVKQMTTKFETQDTEMQDALHVEPSVKQSTEIQCKDIELDQDELRGFCEEKLLTLSPILGFGRTDYFMEYKIDRHISSHILSFVKINQVYKSVILLNKYFKNMIKSTFEQSDHYKNDINFCDYQFRDGDNWYKEGIKVDIVCDNGKSETRLLQSFNAARGIFSLYSYYSRETLSFDTTRSDAPRVAPGYSMTARPCPMHKLAPILKTGYGTQACDINLSSNPRRMFAYRSAALNCLVCLPVGRLLTLEQYNQDFWVCGVIDMKMSLMYANQVKQGFYGNKVDYLLMSQIAVCVDITPYFNQWDAQLKQDIHASPFQLTQYVDGTVTVHLWCQVDDLDIISCFGTKTRVDQQNLAKDFVNKYTVWLGRDHKNVLDAIGHRAYAIETPEGVFDARTHESEFDRWQEIFDTLSFTTEFLASDTMEEKVTQEGLSKVYWSETDPTDTSLYVYQIPPPIIVVDKRVPSPLKTMYRIAPSASVNNSAKVYPAKITDRKLMQKLKQLGLTDLTSEENKGKCLQVLSEWTGLIQISYDITKEFDEFQEYLKYKLNIHEESSEFNNRQYFVENSSMSWLRWDKASNRITYNLHISLERNTFPRKDVKRNLFSYVIAASNPWHDRSSQAGIIPAIPYPLANIFGFCSRREVAPVCTMWNAAVQQAN